MGQLVFNLPKLAPFEKRQASTLHVVGLDGIPWPCRISRQENALRIDRNRDESGHVFLSLPFEDFGELVIATGTLPESTTPYDLLLELARGTANRLRNQLSIWEEGGLVVAAETREQIARAVHALGRAILSATSEDVEKLAQESLAYSMRAIFRIARDFGEQVLPIRKGQINCPAYWFGIQTDQTPAGVLRERIPFADLVQVASKEQIQGDFANVILGPLLDAGPGGLRLEWAEAENFEERQSMILRHVREQIQSLPNSVKMIHAVTGINGLGYRLLSYPQQLQLTLEVLQAIENFGTQCPVMISFDSPWAERLAWSVGGVHPLQIADSILRRGVTLSMLGLDIQLDYWPHGSLPRDPLQWIEMIDIWGQLGLPLVIRLTAPTQFGNFPPEQLRGSTGNSIRQSLRDQQTLELLETVIPLMLARPAVQGLVWTQFQDGMDPRLPGGGIVDQTPAAKGILGVLQRVFSHK